jgi:ATP-dependent RNA helicase A
MAQNVKGFLYQWLGSKKRVVPEYEIRESRVGPKIRFLCELRVVGFSYVGCGNSTTKKDAQVFKRPDGP